MNTIVLPEVFTNKEFQARCRTADVLVREEALVNDVIGENKIAAQKIKNGSNINLCDIEKRGLYNEGIKEIVISVQHVVNVTGIIFE